MAPIVILLPGARCPGKGHTFFAYAEANSDGIGINFGQVV